MAKSRKGLHLVVDLDQKTNLPETKVFLYNTKILVITGSRITFNSGGWRTNHTKNCMNDFLPKGFRVYQRSFDWYLETPSVEVPFSDGMSIDLKDFGNAEELAI